MPAPLVTISPEEIKPVIEDVVQIYLIPHFLGLGMNASGSWVQSLEVRAEVNRAEIWANDYTRYLALGRGPNANQDPDAVLHFTRWAGHYIFKQWLQDKGLEHLNPYAVAHKVATEGTNYYPSGTDLLEVLERPDVVKFVNDRISSIMQVKVKLEFERIVKETFKAA